MKIKFGILAVLNLVLVMVAGAQSIQGRWEIVHTSGDTSTQLNEAGQSSVSTYLLQSGTKITNLPALTTDTLIDDQYSYNNDVITGTVSTSHGTTSVALKLVITNPDKSTVTLNYTGTLSTDSSHGADASVIEGTYTSTGKYTTGGNFVATLFPDFQNVNYSGGLEGPDDVGTGPSDIPVSFQLNTNSSHTLTLTNLSIGGRSYPAGLAGCFDTEHFSTVVDPNYPLAPSAAAGVTLSIYLQDRNGVQLWLSGYAVLSDGVNSAALDELYTSGSYPTSPNSNSNVGQNSELVFVYGLTGGNCDGAGGGDSGFTPTRTRHEHKERKRDRR